MCINYVIIIKKGQELICTLTKKVYTGRNNQTVGLDGTTETGMGSWVGFKTSTLLRSKV